MVGVGISSFSGDRIFTEPSAWRRMSQGLMVVVEGGVEMDDSTRLDIHCWRNSPVSVGDDLMSFKLCKTSSPEVSVRGHWTRI